MTDTIAEIRARHEACGHIEQWPDYDAFMAHTDRATLLRLLDAAREELKALKRSRALDELVAISHEAGLYGDPVLIDADERTGVRIFTPYASAPPSPGAITGIRKAETPCADCIDGWCQMNCGPRVG